MSVTSQETQVRIIAALTEGMSIRATERLTGAHRDTIMRFSVRVGEGCERLHDRLSVQSRLSGSSSDVAERERINRARKNSPSHCVRLFACLDGTQQEGFFSIRVQIRTSGPPQSIAGIQ